MYVYTICALVPAFVCVCTCVLVCAYVCVCVVFWDDIIIRLIIIDYIVILTYACILYRQVHACCVASSHFEMLQKRNSTQCLNRTVQFLFHCNHCRVLVSGQENSAQDNIALLVLKRCNTTQESSIIILTSIAALMLCMTTTELSYLICSDKHIP